MKYFWILCLIIQACGVIDAVEEIEVMTPVSPVLYLPTDQIEINSIDSIYQYYTENYKGWILLYSDSVKAKMRTNTMRNIDSLDYYLPIGLVDYLKENTFIHIQLGYERAAEVRKIKLKVGEPFKGMIKIYTTLSQGTFIHELGHVYDISTNYRIEEKREINKLYNETNLTGQAKENEREFYAEIFRMHLMSDGLEIIDHQSSNFISQNIKHYEKSKSNSGEN